MIITILILAAVTFVALKVHKNKKSDMLLQEASWGVQTHTSFDLLFEEDESEFESKVLSILTELSKDAVFHLNNRRNKLVDTKQHLLDLYKFQESKLGEELSKLSFPKSFNRSSRFRNIRDIMQFDLSAGQPMRFFTIPQVDNAEEDDFSRLYNFLVDKGHEEEYREQIRNIATAYCKLQGTMRRIIKVQNDLNSLDSFMETNAALIDAVNR